MRDRYGHHLRLGDLVKIQKGTCRGEYGTITQVGITAGIGDNTVLDDRWVVTIRLNKGGVITKNTKRLILSIDEDL